jgi:hypothetical protein
MLRNERIYLQPKPWLLNTILDAVELQRGEIVSADTAVGYIRYTTVLYGITREYRFRVADVPRNRTLVRLDVSGEGIDTEQEVLRQFALLESLMSVNN